ncbi:uncharacterized protein LOC111242577 [Vigna radiata var. radiata]|uniref:Uncharacterized protein LOC111242577 n=1 Tax=Vigna radiata var. radiata TaxID=3916 RepID=A0A3Q0FDP9_VIGRR|nr:uncharacterized protein LOC111242577 [Vigna radiata var. radiata]XP_022642196.1 uncharacterized protein LOC111242577 [Vigna radiata var. radiata]
MSVERFQVVVHHGGTLIKDVPFKYIGGEITYWEVDPDKWCYFGIVGSLKEMGYMQVSELYYNVQHVLHKLYDDKEAMTMLKVAHYLGKVNLFVVHGVDNPEVVENDVNDVLYLCEGPVDSEAEVGLDVDNESGAEIENECEGRDDVEKEEVAVDSDVHMEGAVEVENQGGPEVHIEGVGVEAPFQVENECEGGDEVEKEELVVENDCVEGRVEVVNEEVVHVSDVGVDVQSQEEVHSAEEEVEIEKVGGHTDEEEEEVQIEEEAVETDEVEVEEDSEDEPGIEDLSGDEYVVEHSDDEAQPIGRGLSDGEWESDVLLTPQNSGSDEDDIQDRVPSGPFSKYVKQKSMTDYRWQVGTIFTDKEDFKDAIRSYSVHAGRCLKFVKNDKRRVRVRCLGGQGKCPWVAYCGYLPSRKIWQLRKIIDTHTCSRQLNIKMMNAKWLSQEIDKSLMDNPSLKVKDIRSKALRKWNTNVSISKARRAKLIATRQMEIDHKEQFRRIYDYGHELIRCNPGSTVKIKVDGDNGQPIFQRIYVCLKACKDSFRSCRPIVCLDGCFMKGQYKGEVLTAIARDPNEQMLPLAYAVVEVENKETWTWFLQILIEDLGGDEVCGRCTWMSDQQKGLVQAVQDLLPRAEQRFCLRHLYSNFRKRFSGQILKNLLWRAATSTYPQAWEREMLKIKEVNVEAYKYIIATYPPRFWSRSRFTGQAMCDSLDNNITEAFNSVLLHAREQPIINMLEEIRVYLMNRWATNRKKVESMNFTICPKIKTRLLNESKLSKFWIPSWSARKIFEVTHCSAIENKFKVDLDTHDCSCRKWLITGIPCCHAIAAMNYASLDPEEFMPICFKRSTYAEVYASIIYPLNGPLLWEKTPYHDVLPPVHRKLHGRPKKKRRLEAWELTKDHTQMRVGGHIKKCSMCRQRGHNKNNCPLRPGPSQTAESQPSEPTETTENAPSQPTQTPENQPSEAPPTTQSPGPSQPPPSPPPSQQPTLRKKLDCIRKN